MGGYPPSIKSSPGGGRAAAGESLPSRSGREFVPLRHSSGARRIPVACIDIQVDIDGVDAGATEAVYWKQQWQLQLQPMQQPQLQAVFDVDGEPPLTGQILAALLPPARSQNSSHGTCLAWPGLFDSNNNLPRCWQKVSEQAGRATATATARVGGVVCGSQLIQNIKDLDIPQF
jgi:hypothetical protein